MSSDEFDVRIKQKIPKTYIPLRAEKIQRGRSYTSMMVNSQKTMLDNLRFMRQQMAKEERQLQIMKDSLYERSGPSRQRFEDYEFESDNDDVYSNRKLTLSKYTGDKPTRIPRNHLIEHGKLHANVLVNDQKNMIDNLRYMRRQMERDDHRVDVFRGRSPSDRDSSSAQKKRNISNPVAFGCHERFRQFRERNPPVESTDDKDDYRAVKDSYRKALTSYKVDKLASSDLQLYGCNIKDGEYGTYDSSRYSSKNYSPRYRNATDDSLEILKPNIDIRNGYVNLTANTYFDDEYIEPSSSYRDFPRAERHEDLSVRRRHNKDDTYDRILSKLHDESLWGSNASYSSGDFVYENAYEQKGVNNERYQVGHGGNRLLGIADRFC